MEYELIKQRINRVISKLPFLRSGLYKALDLFLLRQWYIKRILKKILKQRQDVFFYDAGSGFGQYSDFVLKLSDSGKVLAVDIDHESILNFKNYSDKRWKGRVTTQNADLQSFCPSQQYHLILAVDILEHIEDDAAVLTNFRNAILPDGVLVISTPKKTKEAHFTAEHFRDGYSPSELQTKLKKAGWQIEKMEYSYGFCGKIAWYLGMKIPLQIYSKKLWFIVPLYLLLFYPLIFVLMIIDYQMTNRDGNGLIIQAKPIFE